jgi:ABC-type multidrug transport system fused ATPase/permease subunit
MNIFKRILKLLNNRERKRLYLLFGVMAVSGVIEVVGISSIMPFLSLISDPEQIQNNDIFNWIYTTLNFESDNRFFIFTGIIVLLIIIISNVLVLLTNYGLLRFTWMRDYTISKRLLGKYLNQPYIFFLNQNTSKLGKNILSEVNLSVRGVIVPLINIFSRGIVTIFIFTLLVVIDPLLSLTVLVVLGGAYILVYIFVRGKLSKIGKKRVQLDTERFKVVNEAFGGIKLLKLLGSENFFIQRYSIPSKNQARYNATNEIIRQFPRYIMEILAFGAIIVIVLYSLVISGGLKDILPLLGLYAFATYRLMPSLEKIFGGITQIRFHIHALNSLEEDIYSLDEKIIFKSDSNEKIKPLYMKKDLKLADIMFNYPGIEIPVIKDLNIKINVNTSVAFVGETGSGKTTIADIILGLLRPKKGKILIDGKEITDDNIKSWQRNLGYIPQDIYLQDDTVTHNIAFGVSEDKINVEAVEYAAKIANIHDFIVKELPNKYQTLIGERGIRLSGGQKQRIGIARALYHDPEVLVLDEATSALDSVTEKAVFKAIQNLAKNKTLIIIAHRLTTVQNCNMIYMLENGNVVGYGKYEELLEDNLKFRKMAKAHLD